jgi:DNA polymerase III sliding clamp (beta) subunit (PCNA family)
VKRLSTVASTDTCIGGEGLSVSDGDMGIVISSDLFKAENRLMVNSRLFNSICSKLTKDAAISWEEGKPLTIRSGKFKADIPILKDKPPEVPQNSINGIKLSGKILNDLLAYASSVTTDGVRFDHTGSVHLEIGIHTLKATATDNLRIAFMTAEMLIEAGIKFLIPSKIVRAIKDLESDIEISESNSCIFFKTNELTVWTKKLTKPFPDIQKVIPKSYKLIVEIKTDELQEALSLLSPTVDQEKPLVIFDFKGDVLGLSCKNSEGSAKHEIEYTPIVPDAFDEPVCFKIGVNENFLKKHLTTLRGCDTIIFKVNGSGSPFLIEAGEKRLLMAGMKI